MTRAREYWVEVDEHGHLVLPAQVMLQYGITPGSQLRMKESQKFLQLHRPLSHLAKVYVEPTSRCNLACRTCIRNAWNEPQGNMAASTWERILASLQGFAVKPDVFFGGFGEPLVHPHILDMVEQAKSQANSVELITNGMLLSEEIAMRLIALDLDVLWISIDGATAENLADVRVGAAFQNIFENIRRLAVLRHETARRPEIGISFVAMQRNINDLPKLLRLGSTMGVSRYMITNVFPYTEEMCKEMLYARTLDYGDSTPSPWSPQVNLPRIDLSPVSQDAIIQSIRYRRNVNWNGVTLGQSNGVCPFIEAGSIAVGWNGQVSPCLPLMHSYSTYLNGQHRTVRKHIIGDLVEQDLHAIWNQPEHVAFRKRVQEFDFAPCTICGGCEMAESNLEDCFGNTFPTCGGCLWAQGVIQCP